MTTRRAFLAGSLASLGSAALPSLARGTSEPTPPRPIRLDAMVPDGPEIDAEAAIAAGITGVVLDIRMYPRGFSQAVEALAEWSWRFRRPGSRLIKALAAADFERAAREGKLAVLLACQDGSILGPSTGSVSPSNLYNLHLFYDLGLRVLQLTHNEQNALGGSFREKRDSGLSRLGETVVAEMNQLGMLIDLSHCGPETTLQAIAASRRPCLITHAGCRARHPSARNKSDAEIRAVAAKGGFFGVYAMSLWLTESPTTNLDDVIDHIDHAVHLAGVEHVGFGSDGSLLGGEDLAESLAGLRAYTQRNFGLPGAERMPDHTVTPELNGPDRLERLGDGLARRGYSRAAVDGILGGNLLRVLREGLGG